MCLITAVQDLKKKVKSTRHVRLKYMGQKFPNMIEFSRPALADWVQANLASGELVLHDDLKLNINGEWDNFRFPLPEPP